MFEVSTFASGFLLRQPAFAYSYSESRGFGETRRRDKDKELRIAEFCKLSE
jgi:hypothetical protein